MPLTCPRCREQRMVEVVTTKATRQAFCAVCSHSWAYDVELCACGAIEAPHIHQSELPTCPKCGKRARLTKPA